MPFFAPLFGVKSFQDVPASEINTWFESFDLYIGESVDDKAVIIAAADNLDPAIYYLNPAHKSGDAWVRIASSVQSRGGRPLILECASCRDCTLEANSTQASPDLCAGFKVNSK
jgi:hypothetical protein